MDKRAVVKLVEQYALSVLQLPEKPSKVMLFGSFAKNNATEGSDIDVAVIYDTITGDILKHYAKLWSLTKSVSIDIEPILLTKDDDPINFISEIERTGEVIWERKNVVG
jgi:predicted nucleotidyltransferase